MCSCVYLWAASIEEPPLSICAFYSLKKTYTRLCVLFSDVYSILANDYFELAIDGIANCVCFYTFVAAIFC